MSSLEKQPTLKVDHAFDSKYLMSCDTCKNFLAIIFSKFPKLPLATIMPHGLKCSVPKCKHIPVIGGTTCTSHTTQSCVNCKLHRKIMSHNVISDYCDLCVKKLKMPPS